MKLGLVPEHNPIEAELAGVLTWGAEVVGVTVKDTHAGRKRLVGDWLA